jgi:integrase
MAGYVRTNEKCPVCRQSFEEELSGRFRVLLCPVCRTAPRRLYVDTSGFGLKTRKRYSDRDGKVFASYEAASQFLDAMRAAKSSRAGWDATEWEQTSRKEYLFEVEWKKFTAARESDWSARYKRQVEWVRVKLVSPRWEGIDVRDLRTAHMIDLKTAISGEGYAPSVVKLVVGITMSFLEEMRRRGDIKENIVRPTVKVPQRDLYILDAVQQERIISKAPLMYQSSMRLAARTGVRPCEVCAVRVKDVVGGFLHFQRSIDDHGNVTDTKTGKIHRKPIPADMEGVISEAMQDKTPGAYLFTGRTGKPHRPCYLSREWKRAANKAWLQGVTLTVGTRHSFATRTWREEEKEAKVRTARAVGHAGPGVTFRHYVAGGIVRELSVGKESRPEDIEKEGKS